MLRIAIVGWLCLAATSVLATTPFDGVFLGNDGDGRNDVFTVTSQGNQVIIADLFGREIEAFIDDQGTFRHSDGEPVEVISTDDFVLGTIGVPGVRLTRVFETDSGFPLGNQPGPFAPQPLLAGDWDIEERSFDLLSGEQLRFGDGSLIFRDVFRVILRPDDGVRFVDSQNVWFQGAMRTGDQLVFQSINNPVANGNGTPVTLPPSANNFARDVLGTGRFINPNQFELQLILQTFDQSNPQQFLLHIQGTRRDPLTSGDLDGDGQTTAQDSDLLAAQFGLTPQDASYNLAADITGDRIVDRRDLDRLNGNEPTLKTVGQWMSGLWFSENRSGEGFHLTVLDTERAVIAWFTYGPDGGQAWMIGNATIVDNELRFDQMQITSGAQFGSGFDPASVIRDSWGRLRIFFDDCNNGWVSWSGVDDFRNGGYQLTRLTQPTGLDCESETVDSTAGLGLYTGIWFDPDQDGAGWFVDQLENQDAVITWFTYDDEGRQQWMIGNGTITAQGLEADQLDETSGARFGGNFNAADVIRSRWGSLTLRSQCESGLLSYSGDDAVRFGSGQQPIVALARIAGQRC